MTHSPPSVTRGALAASLILALALAGCAAFPVPGGGPDIPVRQAQAGLTALGYRAGPVDGIMGPRTEEAIARFRAREDLGLAHNESGIDEAFSRRLAERLAFDGLARRQRAQVATRRAVAAPEADPGAAPGAAPEAAPVPKPVAEQRDETALETLLRRWDAKSD